MMRNKWFGKSIKFLSLLGMTSLLVAQSAWNTGDLSLEYQTFPLPAQSLDLSGSLLSDEVPHEGVGGFELSVGDTNLVTLLAYDLYITDGDTLADIFVILLSDSIPIEEGSYSVNPSPDALKMFIWLTELDPASLASLIDASFSLDDLAVFNPYLSVSGDFDIIDADPLHFEMSFSGVMVNTSIQFRTISNGSFEVWNTLPVPAYSSGSLTYTAGEDSGAIEGALNPLTESEGAGALLMQSNDTLTYNFISFIEDEGVYDVYGVMLIGNEADFPLTGSESIFNISLAGEDLPMAIPYMMRDVALDEFLILLEAGTLPSIDQLTQLYLPVGLGSATFAYSPAGNAELLMENVLMTNSAADVILLSTEWSLTNDLTAVDWENPAVFPLSSNIAGDAYPNPFNSNTLIPIQLSTGQVISVRLYNVQGQEILAREFGYLGAGNQQLSLDLGDSNLGGGLYFFALFSTQGHVGNGSIVYLK